MYQKAKNRQRQNRSPIPQQKFSFQPEMTKQIYYQREKDSQKNSTLQIKGMDKLLERMSKGRQVADIKNQLQNQRGPIMTPQAKIKKGAAISKSSNSFNFNVQEITKSKYTSFGGQDGSQMNPPKKVIITQKG